MAEPRDDNVGPSGINDEDQALCSDMLRRKPDAIEILRRWARADLESVIAWLRSRRIHVSLAARPKPDGPDKEEKAEDPLEACVTLLVSYLLGDADCACDLPKCREQHRMASFGREPGQSLRSAVSRALLGGNAFRPRGQPLLQSKLLASGIIYWNLLRPEGLRHGDVLKCECAEWNSECPLLIRVPSGELTIDCPQRRCPSCYRVHLSEKFHIVQENGYEDVSAQVKRCSATQVVLSQQAQCPVPGCRRSLRAVRSDRQRPLFAKRRRQRAPRSAPVRDEEEERARASLQGAMSESLPSRAVEARAEEEDVHAGAVSAGSTGPPPGQAEPADTIEHERAAAVEDAWRAFVSERHDGFGFKEERVIAALVIAQWAIEHWDTGQKAVPKRKRGRWLESFMVQAVGEHDAPRWSDMTCQQIMFLVEALCGGNACPRGPTRKQVAGAMKRHWDAIAAAYPDHGAPPTHSALRQFYSRLRALMVEFVDKLRDTTLGITNSDVMRNPGVFE